MAPRTFNAPETVVLSDDQFNKLVELLTPGYTVAQAYLAQMANASVPQVSASEQKEYGASIDEANDGSDSNGTD